jgi:uncharacterized protein YjbI with pentapeptide repeats
MSDAPQRPSTDDGDAWKTYWAAQGMPWRTEPEISAERQEYLAARRSVTPNIERGIYPFRDVHGAIKLDRADVEWLLVTHESSGYIGPVDWNDPEQRLREGLDVRGADLSAVDLNSLPLARLWGGSTHDDWLKVSLEKNAMAAVHLERADLHHAQVQGALLRLAQLQRATLWQTQLQGAYLHDAQMQGAYLWGAQLQGANLRQAHMDEATALTNIELDAQTRLSDVVWHYVPLTRVDWEQASILGDETMAWQRKDFSGKVKEASTRLWEFQAAVRANRQLAVVLRAQGLNEDADRFAYNAQVLQRQVLFRQGRFGSFLGSALLDGLAGYGYKPARSILLYLAMIVGFAATYYVLGPAAHLPLSPLEAVVFSVTSFHGRGFAPGANVALSNPLTVLAAGEAVLGLLVEITFIATFTQRFFAR